MKSAPEIDNDTNAASIVTGIPMLHRLSQLYSIPFLPALSYSRTQKLLGVSVLRLARSIPGSGHHSNVVRDTFVPSEELFLAWLPITYKLKKGFGLKKKKASNLTQCR